jgi:threonine 3-dehydrogenase
VKALEKSKAEPGLWLTDVAVPQPGPDDVLIRVRRTGICGTDLHIYRWDPWAAVNVTAPLVVGHEFSGEIVEVGDRVQGLSRGDVVSGEGHLVCGRCRNCMAGRRVQCANTASVGVNRAGAFAEYIALPATNVWHHRPGIDLDVAAIFDPFGNAVHTATAFPLLGEDVLVTGAGPIGIMAAMAARHAGARHVVVTDRSEYRLELARSVGATLAFEAGAVTLDQVMATLGMTEGFDVGFEMSGDPSGLRALLDAMCHGGKVALLGLPEAQFSIDWARLVTNMLTVKGIYGRQMFETWYLMSAFVQSGLDISPVITHRLPAEDFEDAFEVIESGECGKIVLYWDD